MKLLKDSLDNFETRWIVKVLSSALPTKTEMCSQNLLIRERGMFKNILVKKYLHRIIKRHQEMRSRNADY